MPEKSIIYVSVLLLLSLFSSGVQGVDKEPATEVKRCKAYFYL